MLRRRRLIVAVAFVVAVVTGVVLGWPRVPKPTPQGWARRILRRGIGGQLVWTPDGSRLLASSTNRWVQTLLFLDARDGHLIRAAKKFPAPLVVGRGPSGDRVALG